MIINGSADWGVSDPLSLIKVVAQFQADGISSSDIERIALHNAMDFYSQSPHWNPDFEMQPMDPREFQR